MPHDIWKFIWSRLKKWIVIIRLSIFSACREHERSCSRDFSKYRESKGQSGYNWYKAVLRCSNPRIGFLPSIIYFFRRGYKHIHCSAFSAFYIWPFGRIWNGYWIYTISLYSFKSLLSLLPKARNKTLENSIQQK